MHSINRNTESRTRGPTTPLSPTLPMPSVEATRNESLAGLIDALLNSTKDSSPEASTEAQGPSDQAEKPGKQALQELLSHLLKAIQSWLQGGQSGEQGRPEPSASAGGERPSQGGGARPEPAPRGAPQAPSSPGAGATPPDASALPAHNIDTSKVDTSKIPDYNALSPKVQEAAKIAVAMGLRVTSTTGGKHSTTSNHYKHNSSDGKGHAIDIAGPPELMAKFYNTMKGLDSNPRELFYDPLGGIKRGQEIGPIGGHSDHVHYAA